MLRLRTERSEISTVRTCRHVNFRRWIYGHEKPLFGFALKTAMEEHGTAPFCWWGLDGIGFDADRSGDCGLFLENLGLAFS